MYISDDYKCENCNYVFIELNDRDHRPEILDCSECGEEGTAIKQFSSPISLKASYHDGKDRGDDWKKLKEANKLTKQMHELAPEKRGELRGEITKLKKLNK